VVPTKTCSRWGGAPPPGGPARARPPGDSGPGGGAPGAGGGGAGRPEKVMRAGQLLRAGAGAPDKSALFFALSRSHHTPRTMPFPFHDVACLVCVCVCRGAGRGACMSDVLAAHATKQQYVWHHIKQGLPLTPGEGVRTPCGPHPTDCASLPTHTALPALQFALAARRALGGAHWQRPHELQRPVSRRSSAPGSPPYQALSRPGSSRMAHSSRAFSSAISPLSVPPHTKPFAWFLRARRAPRVAPGRPGRREHFYHFWVVCQWPTPGSLKQQLYCRH